MINLLEISDDEFLNQTRQRSIQVLAAAKLEKADQNERKSVEGEMKTT